jgi:hypothetical protein
MKTEKRFWYALRYPIFNLRKVAKFSRKTSPGIDTNPGRPEKRFWYALRYPIFNLRKVAKFSRKTSGPGIDTNPGRPEYEGILNTT